MRPTHRYLVYFLLHVIATIFVAEGAQSSRRIVYASSGTPFRRSLTPKVAETKSLGSDGSQPLDYDTIQQTPIEPELRLGM